MRAVVTRVSEASVTVAGEPVAAIGPGLLVLLGVHKDDRAEDAAYMAKKILDLRIFPDGEGKMNRSLQDVGGEVLLVSQFTLHGDVRRGNRPSFIHAAPGEVAEPLYEAVGQQMAALGAAVRFGSFGAHMAVASVNDGPVTILIDSARTF